MVSFPLSIDLTIAVRRDSAIMNPMKTKSLLAALVVLLLPVNGCVHLSDILDIPKAAWGSSTKALEALRDQAFAKTYVCSWGECFDEVLKTAKNANLKILINNKKKKKIILMGINEPGDTTEAGVFFSDLKIDRTRVEITSLSQETQSKAASFVFNKLGEIFHEVE